MSRISTRSYRPHFDFERLHLNLFNAIVHGYSAYDDLPKVLRERLFSLFLDACGDCHCPDDIRQAVFNVLICRCDYVAASVDYFVSSSCLHKWRRRVIRAIARQLLFNDSVRYDV